MGPAGGLASSGAWLPPPLRSSPPAAEDQLALSPQHLAPHCPSVSPSVSQLMTPSRPPPQESKILHVSRAPSWPCSPLCFCEKGRGWSPPAGRPLKSWGDLCSIFHLLGPQFPYLPKGCDVACSRGSKEACLCMRGSFAASHVLGRCRLLSWFSIPHRGFCEGRFCGRLKGAVRGGERGSLSSGGDAGLARFTRLGFQGTSQHL